VNKAIDSLYESRSHFEIASALAEKMGINDFSDKTEGEWLTQIFDGLAQFVPDITDYSTFRKRGIHKIKTREPYVAFRKEIEDPENTPFRTPSGKIEIYSQTLAEMNDPELPPIPKYIEPWESPNDQLSRKHPLQLITTHFKRRAHSQFDNLPWLEEFLPQAISINNSDAVPRGIRDGDFVRVFNGRGALIIRAKLTERIIPGTVEIPQGAWYKPDENGVDRGGSANILTKSTISPGGAVPTNTCLVQVEKHEE
jgi:anaerobic dimethyl sulfoxide reductase subunit A